MKKIILAAALGLACAGEGWAASALSWDRVVASKAEGCDSFTPTLAPDGNQYTGFSDCTGLTGKRKKVSLGLGRIIGGPTSPTVEDLPTPDLTYYGDGQSGEKASSALIVGSTLYMWVRNQKAGTQARLKYSSDYTKASGSDWRWAPWSLTQFGYPVFVQGAPDTYAYIVAHDSSSAYKPASQYVMMRVAQDKLLDQSAYEYFSGTAAKPAWSRSYAARQPIFTAPGECYRSGISYNQARGRYYWWQNTGDTKTTGRFRVLSGPNLWGPWTEVYYTARWDISAGERGEFPVKWMGSEPLEQPGTLYLLFSGNDQMQVRQATIAAGL